MEPTFYADILFFAAVACFIAYRLYTVLGRKDGTEQNVTHRVKELWDTKIAEATQKEAAKSLPQAPAIPVMPQIAKSGEVSYKNVVEAAQSAVKAIVEKDRSFNPDQFLSGAQSAFEIILNAFAQGNKPYLKNLLDAHLYKEFETHIDVRVAAGDTLTTTLVALVRAEIVAAKLESSTAIITVSFESEQISCTKNAAGEVLSGNPKVSERLYDTWVFERDLNSRNPVWLLTDTHAAE